MGPFTSLCLLSLIMSVSTFFFGLLPLTLRLSRLTLRILEVGGAGLLLGAACSVVLPEGAGTIFREEATEDHTSHRHRRGLETSLHARGLVGWEPENLLAVAFLSGVLLMFIIDQIMSPGAHSHDNYQHHDEEHLGSSFSSTSAASHSSVAAPHHTRPHSQSRSIIPHQHATQDTSRPIRRLTRPETLLLTRSSSVIEAAMSHDPKRGPQRFDGLPPASPRDDITTVGSLPSPLKSHQDSAAGSETEEISLPADYETFSHGQRGHSAFREACDKTSSLAAGGLQTSGSSDDVSHPQHASGGGNDYGTTISGRRRSALRRRSGSDLAGSKDQPRGLRRAFTSILGLIIHAACDGIAMGASSASKDEGLKLVVVGAIMIHKAPAAFGLCSLLLSQRLTRQDIKRAMGIFSLATPIGAVTTYLLLSVFFTGDAATPELGGSSISAKHIGSALIFSGGSFLYVALDAVHELASHSADVHTVWQEASPSHAQRGEGSEGGERPGAESDVEEEEDDDDDDDGESSSFTGNERAEGHGYSGRQRRQQQRQRRRRRQHDHRGAHLVPFQRQTLGRTGRIAVLIIGALLPRTLQTMFGHGH